MRRRFSFDPKASVENSKLAGSGPHVPKLAVLTGDCACWPNTAERGKIVIAMTVPPPSVPFHPPSHPPVYISMYLSLSLYIYIYIYMYIYIYIYVFIDIYVSIYASIYISLLRWLKKPEWPAGVRGWSPGAGRGPIGRLCSML